MTDTTELTLTHKYNVVVWYPPSAEEVAANEVPFLDLSVNMTKKDVEEITKSRITAIKRVLKALEFCIPSAEGEDDAIPEGQYCLQVASPSSDNANDNDDETASKAQFSVIHASMLDSASEEIPSWDNDSLKVSFDLKEGLIKYNTHLDTTVQPFTLMDGVEPKWLHGAAPLPIPLSTSIGEKTLDVTAEKSAQVSETETARQELKVGDAEAPSREGAEIASESAGEQPSRNDARGEAAQGAEIDIAMEKLKDEDVEMPSEEAAEIGSEGVEEPALDSETQGRHDEETKEEAATNSKDRDPFLQAESTFSPGENDENTPPPSDTKTQPCHAEQKREETPTTSEERDPSKAESTLSSGDNNEDTPPSTASDSDAESEGDSSSSDESSTQES